MRVRNKKIVLVQSINPYQKEKDSQFIEHKDEYMPMKIYRKQIEEEDSLAEIFYQALLNQTIKNRQKQSSIRPNRILSITPFSTDCSQKRPNSGRIVRRSLSVNNTPSKSPQMKVTQTISTQLKKYQSLTSRTSRSSASKQNSKIAQSPVKKIANVGPMSSKKSIKYKVKSVRY